MSGIRIMWRNSKASVTESDKEHEATKPKQISNVRGGNEYVRNLVDLDKRNKPFADTPKTVLSLRQRSSVRYALSIYICISLHWMQDLLTRDDISINY